jgi:hypothetical protein
VPPLLAADCGPLSSALSSPTGCTNRVFRRRFRACPTTSAPCRGILGSPAQPRGGYKLVSWFPLLCPLRRFDYHSHNCAQEGRNRRCKPPDIAAVAVELRSAKSVAKLSCAERVQLRSFVRGRSAACEFVVGGRLLLRCRLPSRTGLASDQFTGNLLPYPLP